MQIGTKIYFEKNNGNIILELGDIEGYVVDTTEDQDFENYKVLNKYNKDSVGKIQLEFGELNKLLLENKANKYKVDVSGDTPKLVFEYINPDTNKPSIPPKTSEEIIDEKIEKAKDDIMKNVVKMILSVPTEKITPDQVPPLTDIISDDGLKDNGLEMPIIDSSMVPPMPSKFKTVDK